MKQLFIRMTISILCCLLSSISLGSTPSDINKNNTISSDIIQVKIDNIVIDTDNLVSASSSLSTAILDVSDAIKNTSDKNINLSVKERQILVNAAENISIASKALSKLATELPKTTDKISNSLPEIIKEAQEPIANISNSIQSLGGSVITIADALPDALENTKKIVDQATNSILFKMYIFIGIFFLLLVITIGAIIFYMHRKLVSPVVTKLNEFSSLPNQLTEMATHMKVTSENLLVIQKNTLDTEKNRANPLL